jgi:hypothetical protein
LPLYNPNVANCRREAKEEIVFLPLGSLRQTQGPSQTGPTSPRRSSPGSIAEKFSAAYQLEKTVNPYHPPPESASMINLHGIAGSDIG